MELERLEKGEGGEVPSSSKKSSSSTSLEADRNHSSDAAVSSSANDSKPTKHALASSSASSHELQSPGVKGHSKSKRAKVAFAAESSENEADDGGPAGKKARLVAYEAGKRYFEVLRILLELQSNTS
jgi:hypothetical protein